MALEFARDGYPLLGKVDAEYLDFDNIANGDYFVLGEKCLLECLVSPSDKITEMNL